MRTEVDTPEAYRKTVEVSIPPWITDVEELRQLRNTSLFQDEFDAILGREERLFGVSAYSESFFDKRAEFKQSAELFAQHTFTGLASELCGTFAEYFSRDGKYSQEELEEIFRSRLDGLEGVFLADPLLTPPVSATHFANYGLMRVNAKALEMVQTGEKSLNDYFIKTILAHEFLHIIMTSALTKGALEVNGRQADLITRNGLATSHSQGERPVRYPGELVGNLEWVNEAFIEDVRQRVLKTRTGAYPMKLAVLRTLQAFDPYLEFALRRVAITSAPPVEVMQRIEDVLGPLGAEHVEDIIASQEAPWENQLVAGYIIEEIAALFPASIRINAESELLNQWADAKQHLLV